MTSGILQISRNFRLLITPLVSPNFSFLVIPVRSLSFWSFYFGHCIVYVLLKFLRFLISFLVSLIFSYHKWYGNSKHNTIACCRISHINVHHFTRIQRKENEFSKVRVSMYQVQQYVSIRYQNENHVDHKLNINVQYQLSWMILFCMYLFIIQVNLSFELLSYWYFAYLSQQSIYETE